MTRIYYDNASNKPNQFQLHIPILPQSPFFSFRGSSHLSSLLLEKVQVPQLQAASSFEPVDVAQKRLRGVIPGPAWPFLFADLHASYVAFCRLQEKANGRPEGRLAWCRSWNVHGEIVFSSCHW